MATDQNNQNAAEAPLEFPPELMARAREFFAKGAEVAYTLNYDYAVEVFLDGLSLWPDALAEGHQPLREIALRRQAAGQKKSGMRDNSKYRKAAGKNPKEAMLKAEYLLSKDPNNAKHLADMAKAAAEGGYRQTAKWVTDTMFDVVRHKDKVPLQTYVFLRDTYAQAQEFVSALQMCQLALQLKPNDPALQDAHRDLSAQATMQEGKYDSDTDFRDSIKDPQEQQKMHKQSGGAGLKADQDDALAEARADFQANPNVPGKINKLVAALTAAEDEPLENEAIEILENAFTQSSRFQYKQRSGEIRIKQINRSVRDLQAQLKAHPEDKQLAQKAQQAGQQGLKTELEHYRLCVESYPTDMGLKFEYGRRLVRAKQYDTAIPMFQDSRSDPRHRIASINYIGQCFYHKQWYADAVETFQQALEAVQDSEGAVAKELRYNLGRAYEADENTDEALNCFRKVAQIDFNYLDVKDRVDTLRKKQKG